MIRLLEDPTLIHQELDRRLAATHNSDPTRKREQSLQRELTHVHKGIERLLNAYQEGLLSIEQLRERMPVLRQRQQAFTAELQAIADQTDDRAAFLRLAETLTAFLGRLRSAAETLSVIERRKIVRLLVKDVLVGEDTITIRHSIPIPSSPPQNEGSGSSDGRNYLLCKGRDHSSLRRTHLRLRPFAVFRHARRQPFLDQPQQSVVGHPMFEELQHPLVINVVKEALDVGIENPVHPPLLQPRVERIKRLVRVASRPEPIRKAPKIRLINLIENGHHGLLNNQPLTTR